MMFDRVYNRSELRDLPAKRRRETVIDIVQKVYDEVYRSATLGNMFHLVDVSKLPIICSDEAKRNTAPHIPTIDDMVIGFRNKFPDCKVEYTEMWEDVKPGVRQQKRGILIDWS